MQYLNKLGLPSKYIASIDDIITYINYLVKDIDKHYVNTENVVSRLENPKDEVIKIVDQEISLK